MATVPLRTQPDAALPSPPLGVGGFSLFFDLDGTLIEIAETPDGVVVEPALLAALITLADRLPGRVAVVSGRSLAQLDRLLGTAVTERLTLAGSHGAELRVPGTDRPAGERPASLDAASLALDAFAGPRGLLVERKTMGTALHYRQVPAMAAAAEAEGVRLADEHGLTLQRGKMLVELRAPGDKGSAIAALLAMPAMATTRPLFFGDDVTDEDGFVAAAHGGGGGVLVGDPRPTAAMYRLPDVASVRDWIDRTIEELS